MRRRFQRIGTLGRLGVSGGVLPLSCDIEPFLEAIGQLGEVIEFFLNASELVSFIWVCIIITCSGPYIGLLIDSRVPSN